MTASGFLHAFLCSFSCSFILLSAEGKLWPFSSRLDTKTLSMAIDRLVGNSITASKPVLTNFLELFEVEAAIAST